MRYRNIFFSGNIINSGNGSSVLEYTGKLYSNATTMTDFYKLYDPKQDKVISCGKCFKKAYSSIVKI